MRHTEETYTKQTFCPKCLDTTLSKAYESLTERLCLTCLCGYTWIVYPADKPEVLAPYSVEDDAMEQAEQYLLQGGWLRELVGRMIVLCERGFTLEQVNTIAASVGDKAAPEMQAQLAAKYPGEPVDEAEVFQQ